MTIHTPACSTIQYDHLQFFVDALKPLAHYKAIEERLTSFAKLHPHARRDIAAARKAWCKMGSASDPEAFQVHGRDLVEVLSGLQEGEAVLWPAAAPPDAGAPAKAGAVTDGGPCTGLY